MSENDYIVNVTAKTTYVKSQSIPEKKRFVFAYNISIANDGKHPVTLLRRRWLITDANCKMQEVQGDGVIGKQPRIMPGESFKYTSAAILETPVGCMQGSYEMISDDGVEFDALIPVFNLSMPNALH